MAKMKPPQNKGGGGNAKPKDTNADAKADKNKKEKEQVEKTEKATQQTNQADQANQQPASPAGQENQKQQAKAEAPSGGQQDKGKKNVLGMDNDVKTVEEREGTIKQSIAGQAGGGGGSGKPMQQTIVEEKVKTRMDGLEHGANVDPAQFLKSQANDPITKSIVRPAVDQVDKNVTKGKTGGDLMHGRDEDKAAKAKAGQLPEKERDSTLSGKNLGGAMQGKAPESGSLGKAVSGDKQADNQKGKDQKPAEAKQQPDAKQPEAKQTQAKQPEGKKQESQQGNKQQTQDKQQPEGKKQEGQQGNKQQTQAKQNQQIEPPKQTSAAKSEGAGNKQENKASSAPTNKPKGAK